ncbi:nucleoporin-like protein 2 [Carassius auratus]|uniref:Nucleoporin NUP42 n=1 Tax=Carassius auratus TaxID=7957 RepID=A0A6P6LUC6_CARAU|nr:nucleoporin-like protein 2 [Carassius auratus]
MTVCNFFLQGRCRYGDKCWNEHPRGGRGGDFRGNQQPSRGGYGNRVWINPSQRSGGDYVQQSSFSRDGNNDWSRGGGGGGGGGTPRDVKSSDFSFSSQNRFSALTSHTPSEKDAQSSTDDVDTIQKDMEVWQTSGQWPFSCYSVLPGKLSGFVEVSPEELRLEYYSGRASGDLQAYMSSVQQLADQWRSRVQELRSMSSSTRISVISELNNPSLQTSTPGSGFGSTASGFGATSSSSSSSSTGFGAAGFGQGSQSSSTFSFAPSKTGFGAASSTQHASGVVSGVLAQPSSGFGCAPAASASSFSFSEPQASSVSVSVSSFSFRPSPGESSASAVLQSGSSGVFGADTALFSTHTDLTAEELKEFTSKRFTLGQIPLKPPPADLLVL